MPQITVSDATYAKLQDLGRQLRAADEAKAEHSQLIDALIAGFQQLQELPGKLQSVQAALETAKAEAVQAVAGELAAPPPAPIPSP